MLHRKPHIENHLQSAQKRLADRLELLTAKGVDADRIKKDNIVKKFNAEVRKAKQELAAIAAVQTLMAEKADSRERKKAAAASEALNRKSKKRDKNAPPAKKRRKRRMEEEENGQLN